MLLRANACVRRRMRSDCYTGKKAHRLVDRIFANGESAHTAWDIFQAGIIKLLLKCILQNTFVKFLPLFFWVVIKCLSFLCHNKTPPIVPLYHKRCLRLFLLCELNGIHFKLVVFFLCIWATKKIFFAFCIKVSNSSGSRTFYMLYSPNNNLYDDFYRKKDYNI